jgi:pyrroline-5-carboxylate reductase
MKVSFIGGGNMATALIKGLIKANICSEILVVEPLEEQRHRLTALIETQNADTTSALLSHFNCSAEITPSTAQTDVIVLAVKPQQMEEACKALAKQKLQALVISIAAGTRIESIQTWLGGYKHVARAMPNTPATLGLGITGLVASDEVTAAQRAAATAVLQAAGAVLWVHSEAMIDAVTAVSGSGPGYIFYLMEAMQQGAIAQGFSPDEAKLLTEHTFAGASQLALQSGTPFSTLREQVTSKGGTTFAGLESLKNAHVAQSFVNAITAAKNRAQELGAG